MEAPGSLGEYLRQEREKKGITLEQVASATRISTRILHALEADHYAELPAKPFVRGFVTAYARFIGLDAKEILTQYNRFLDEKAQDRPINDQGHSGYAFERREGEQSRTILWFIMGGFLILGSLVLIVLKPTLRHHRTTHIDRLRSVHGSPSPSPSPEIPETAAPKPSPSPKTTPKPTPKPSAIPEGLVSPGTVQDPNDPLNTGVGLKKEDIKHKVVIRAVDDIWVRFQADDRKPMRFILRKDKMLIIRAKDGMRFQASEPKFLRYNYNNQAAKLMTEEKTAKELKGDLTVFYPPQLSETITEPFKDARIIHKMPVPAPAAPKTEPSPTP